MVRAGCARRRRGRRRVRESQRLRGAGQARDRGRHVPARRQPGPALRRRGRGLHRHGQYRDDPCPSGRRRRAPDQHPPVPDLCRRARRRYDRCLRGQFLRGRCRFGLHPRAPDQRRHVQNLRQHARRLRARCRRGYRRPREILRPCGERRRLAHRHHRLAHRRHRRGRRRPCGHHRPYGERHRPCGRRLPCGGHRHPCGRRRPCEHHRPCSAATLALIRHRRLRHAVAARRSRRMRVLPYCPARVAGRCAWLHRRLKPVFRSAPKAPSPRQQAREL